MRLYHFVSSVYGLEDIAKRRLKVATIGDLNDPFELLAWAYPTSGGRKALRSTKAQISSMFGLLCFSRNWHNPVQWSHYAERHRGLCLGFDVPDEIAVPVQYRAKRLVPDEQHILSIDADLSGEVLASLSTKYSHWRYENEVRIHTSLTDRDEETGLFFQSFGPDLVLREVIVGSESRLTRADIQRALGDLSSNVDVFRGRLAFKSFRVVRLKRADLWD